MKVSDGKRGCIVRFLFVLFILAISAALAGFFIAMSPSANRICCSWLSNGIGLELRAKRLHIGLPYDLVFDEVSSVNTINQNHPLFSAQQVRIGIGKGLRIKVELKSPLVNLKYQKDGTWMPRKLNELGNLIFGTLEGINDITYSFRKWWQIKIESGTIRWFDERGVKFASMRGVSFSMEPVEIGEHRMYYYNLKIENAEGVANITGEDIMVDWLSDTDKSYIEISRSGRIGSGAVFWDIIKSKR